MEKTGWIEKFNREFLREKVFSDEAERTSPSRKKKAAQNNMSGYLKEVGKSGDIDLILAVERRFLENELAEYANSREMRNSLKAALTGLTATEHLVDTVCDPARYKGIDDAHVLPRNRKGAVPWDEARQFFASHAARLLNQDKSRLEPAEKALIDQRKANLRAAEKIYTAHQRQALGLAPGPGAAQGLGL